MSELKKNTNKNVDNTLDMYSAIRLSKNIYGDLILRFDFDSAFKEKVLAIPSIVDGEVVKYCDFLGIPPCVTTLFIPKTIDGIHGISYISGNTHKLKSIQIHEDNPRYWSDGNAIFTKDKTMLLRFLSCKKKEYFIPEGTVAIGEHAFENMSELKTLILPRSMRKIGSCAFKGCRSLENIQGLDSIVEVGNNILYPYCPFAKSESARVIGSALLRWDDFSKKKIIIDEGIVRISESVFDGKREEDNIEEIVLPKSLKVIERFAFRDRKKLREIKIPDGVQEISSSLFSGCEGLETIYIPSSVKEINISAFPCQDVFYDGPGYALKEIIVDPNNPYFCSVNGKLYSKEPFKLLFEPDMCKKIENDTVSNEIEATPQFAKSNISIFTQQDSVPEDVLLKLDLLYGDEDGLTGESYKESNFCSDADEFYSYKYGVQENDELAWLERSKNTPSVVEASKFLNIINELMSTFSGRFVVSCSYSSSKYPWIENVNKEIRNLTGSFAAVKFVAPIEELYRAFPDIEKEMEGYKKLFCSVIGYFEERKIAEIRYEFDEKEDPDFESFIKSFKKKYPNIRIMGVSQFDRIDRTVYVSGNASNKINKETIVHESSWDSDYNHLCNKSIYWNNPEIYEPDIYLSTSSNENVLQYVNDFNWTDTLNIEECNVDICGVAGYACYKNKHIANIIFSSTLKWIEREAFAYCSNLKHVFFYSNISIGKDVFYGCNKVTIHAPLGSYAEQYAKEHNIPFVAE